MPLLQDLIHKFEEGAGKRRLRKFLAVLALLAFVGLCNWREFRNFSTQEAMDSAQLARNISEGKGYKTLFVRPFSIYLVETVNRQKLGPPPADKRVDYAEIRDTMHPDVSNPPAYPLVLAGWMKTYHLALKGMDAFRNILPGAIKNRLPRFNDSIANPLWKSDGRLGWSPGDFFISVFNQLLFFALIVLVFFWAKRLFDPRVAWTSAALLIGSEFLWRFSFSGLSTMLLLFIFMGLIWVLTLMDREMREPKWKPQVLLALAAFAGLLTGIAGLTRYSLLWLIIPLAIFVIIFGGQRRVVLTLALLAVFALITIPWIARSYHLTHTPFGTSSYSVFEGGSVFQDYRLQRALQPEFSRLSPDVAGRKLLANVHVILQNDIPKLGGSWVTVLFLAGLLIGFVNVTLRRMRYFLLMCLGILIVVQALARTQLSEDVPEFNSENLLVLLLPLVTVYGVSLFFVLLDRMTFPAPALRNTVIALFLIILSQPLIFGLLPPRPSAVVDPPYNPGLIEFMSGWMKPDELVMSDMPWAVAWYGKRQSVWLTLDTQTDFYAMSDFKKTVSALYLTELTTDKATLLGSALRANGWGHFVFECFARKQIPASFPLGRAAPRLAPHQLFLTDWERWNTPN